MKTDQIVMLFVALLLGMLLANMLKSVCGCKVMEGAVYSHTDLKLDTEGKFLPNADFKNETITAYGQKTEVWENQIRQCMQNGHSRAKCLTM